MAHLVGPLVTGFAGAASGTAEFYVMGTATLSTEVYSDANGVTPVTTTTLDSTGSAVRYIAEPCDVVVKTSAGATYRQWTEISDARVIRVENDLFSGPDASGQTVEGGRTILHDDLTLFRESLGTDNAQVTVNGTDFQIKDAISSSTGLYFNVKTAYGAAGNGTTDDTSAIQAAINAAQNAGGGVVFFPAGTYKISAVLSVTTAITLQGVGHQKSIIRQVTTGLSPGWLQLSAEGIVVRGIAIDCSPTTITGSNLSIALAAQGSLIDSCRFLSGAGSIINATADFTKTITFTGCIFQVQNASGSWMNGTNTAYTSPKNFVGCSMLTDVAPSGALITSGNTAFIGGQINGPTSGSASVFADGYHTMSGVFVLSQAGGGTMSLVTSNAVLQMSGCTLRADAGTLRLAVASTCTLQESGSFFSVAGTLTVFATSVNPVSYSFSRDRRRIETSVAGTSYTPDPDYGVHMVEHTSGAAMAFNNPTVTAWGNDFPLTILYHNTTGAGVTPTWGTSYSGVPATAVGNGNTAMYVFRHASIDSSPANEWVCVTTAPVVAAA